MRKKKEDFWETPEDWSKRKHLILTYYLHPATPKLRKASPDGRVILLDAFAGRGAYRDGSPGSPMRMGRLADTCAQWQNPLRLRIVNVEPDPLIYSELGIYTAEWVRSGTMLNLNSTFRDALPSILKEADSSPIFAFLDPFRPSDLPFEDFLPLLYRTAPTEICFVLHTPRIHRMIRAVQTENQAEQALRNSISTLDGVFGSTRWKQLTGRQTFDPRDVAICFQDELKSRSNTRNFIYMIHPIEARYGKDLKYHIIFRTRHEEGVKLMNDAFWKEAHAVYSSSTLNEQLAFDWSGTLEVKGPSVEQDRVRRLILLEEELEEIEKEHSNRMWVREELAFELLKRRFGEFSITEYRQAVDSLLQKGRLNPHSHCRRTKSGEWITNNKTEVQFVMPERLADQKEID